MASYSYERDITPEDLIQETPPPLTPRSSVPTGGTTTGIMWC